ncbi:MAG TPA: hypothetical protein PKN30_02905 [Flavobacteriales bacterium]|nr:hypothetical protein [Flavobacteriales bacterium]
MSKAMSMQLIRGEFKAADALDLITQMIHVKIRFHEEHIRQDSSEEDIKYRESRIKQLQKELYELRQRLDRSPTAVKLDGIIKIVEP